MKLGQIAVDNNARKINDNTLATNDGEHTFVYDDHSESWTYNGVVPLAARRNRNGNYMFVSVDGTRFNHYFNIILTAEGDVERVFISER